MVKRTYKIIALAGLLLASHVVISASNVIINGQPLSLGELAALEVQLGTRIAPGNYLFNPQNGCWSNLSTGQSGCLGGGSGAYNSRYGSGGRDAHGNWNHWSDLSGGAVGGTSDGCIYTSYGWSNC